MHSALKVLLVLGTAVGLARGGNLRSQDVDASLNRINTLASAMDDLEQSNAEEPAPAADSARFAQAMSPQEAEELHAKVQVERQKLAHVEDLIQRLKEKQLSSSASSDAAPALAQHSSNSGDSLEQHVDQPAAHLTGATSRDLPSDRPLNSAAESSTARFKAAASQADEALRQDAASAHAESARAKIEDVEHQLDTELREVSKGGHDARFASTAQAQSEPQEQQAQEQQPLAAQQPAQQAVAAPMFTPTIDATELEHPMGDIVDDPALQAGYGRGDNSDDAAWQTEDSMAAQMSSGGLMG